MKKEEFESNTLIQETLEALKDHPNVELALKQLSKATLKGRTGEMDAKINNQFQLVQAAQTLSQKKLTTGTAWEPPHGWNEKLWSKYCVKPYKARLAIAAALLISEMDRVDFCDNNDLPLIPPIKQKPATAKPKTPKA